MDLVTRNSEIGNILQEFLVFMIESLAEGLRLRYGEITKSNGTTLKYLGMVIDFSHPDDEGVC
jgi:hypothetical protein